MTFSTAPIGLLTQTPRYRRGPRGLLTTGLAHTAVSWGTCGRTECTQEECGSPSHVKSGNEILRTLRATVRPVFIIVITASFPLFHQASVIFLPEAMAQTWRAGALSEQF